MRVIRTAGYQTLPPIDTDEYGPIQGLEGPFRMSNGRTVYYEATAQREDGGMGRYYDRKTDMYLSVSEEEELAKERGNPEPENTAFRTDVTAAKSKKKEEASLLKEGDEEEGESFTRIFDLNREKNKD